MNKNCLKYLQDIKYLQVSLAEKIEIKHLCRATSDLINYQSSSSRKQIYVRKLTMLCTLTKSGWVDVLKESLYYALLINHIINPATDLP